MQNNSIHKKFLRIAAAIFITSAAADGLYAFQKRDTEAYNACRNLIHARKWNKAVTCCSLFVRIHPSSSLADDALFWQAFALEQSHRDDSAALALYRSVETEYPQSPWADDAVIHQIGLEKKLAARGSPVHLSALRAFLNHPDKNAVLQAALGLAELRDDSAVPVLEQFVRTGNDETARLALQSLNGFSGKPGPAVRNQHTISQDQSAYTETPALLRSALNKKSIQWSEEELLYNGLFHIVPPRTLAFFLSMEQNWDKTEWLRKFWAPYDPTPTTEKNEAREEFQRRVLYAYDNFGMPAYNKDRYYPPWDCRGEAYIKFGEPDKRTELDKNWEEWTYYAFRIILKVGKNRRNLDSRGITLNITSRSIYRRDLARKISFLKKNRFRYTHKPFENMKKLERFNLFIKKTEKQGSRISITFQYSFPLWNLAHTTQKTGPVTASYSVRWVVYNTDHEPVITKTGLNTLQASTTGKLYKKIETRTISARLIPGSYTLALRIEDSNSRRTGIFTKKFTIHDK